MKKFIVLIALAAITGIAGAGQQLLPNTSFETFGDDGYGRMMPQGYGLWTEDWNWGNIPGVQVVTTDAMTGNASFQMDTSSSGAPVALTYTLGQLGTDVGLGWYHVGGLFKGNVSSADIGIDIFSPDWGQFWWGGGSAIATSGDWTYVGFDFEVTNPDANYNFRVKSTPGSSFLIDDVQLVTEVPEPATMLLLGLGGLVLSRRRKA